MHRICEINRLQFYHHLTELRLQIILKKLLCKIFIKRAINNIENHILRRKFMFIIIAVIFADA